HFPAFSSAIPYSLPHSQPSRTVCTGSRAGVALEFSRRGARSARQGPRPAVRWGDECNEIGLKFSPDLDLSAS
ncbi:hypothetical protein AVEN_24993-1, partial [Araneus ventricosus]